MREWLTETTAPMVAALAGFALAVAVGEAWVIPLRTAPAEARAGLYRAEAERWRAEATAAHAELDAARRADLDPAGGERIPPPGVPER